MKKYGVFEVTYDSYNSDATAHWNLRLFEAMMCKPNPRTNPATYFMTSKHVTESKEDALNEAAARRRYEAYEQKTSLCNRYKTRFLVKEVDENNMPKLTEAGKKKLVAYVKENHPAYLEDIKDEYKEMID